MKSISKRIAQLQQTKARTSKIRSKTIRSLKSAKLLHRKSTSSGSLTGKSVRLTGTDPQFLQLIIGIGHPQ